jgi:hypothetical protein
MLSDLSEEERSRMLAMRRAESTLMNFREAEDRVRRLWRAAGWTSAEAEVVYRSELEKLIQDRYKKLRQDDEIVARKYLQRIEARMEDWTKRFLAAEMKYRINRAEELEAMENLEKIESKNGFVFFTRKSGQEGER